MRRIGSFRQGLALAINLAPAAVAGQVPVPNSVASIPPGYHLQAYDDCGAQGRQSHILQTTAGGIHTFTTSEVNADERVRSVARGWKQVDALYEDLDQNLDYVLAVTYANEAFNNRVQSLWADSIPIHGPHALPKGGSERLLFRVPKEAIKNGRLALQFKLEAQVNVVVSVVELWAIAPSPSVLHLCDVTSLYSDLAGTLRDLRCDPVADATVELRKKGRSAVISSTKSGPDGRFAFKRKLVDSLKSKGDLEVVAEAGGANTRITIPKDELYFQPVRYRPIPTRVLGLSVNQISLDGAWSIATRAPERARRLPLDAPEWGPLRVPGQWLQQGYDVPLEKPVAVSRQFIAPRNWAGYRTILRFDAIHAGTRYWLNGKYLGASENLFTPVEWDVTEAVRPGQTNRLDLEMVVDTPSERLSFASGYAFHSLGGIDRSAHLYALPKVHVRDLHVAVDLDRRYRDANLDLNLTMSNAGPERVGPITLALRLFGPNGKPVQHTLPEKRIAQLARGRSPVQMACRVSDPAKWTAEQPRLHRFVLELKRGDQVIECIERSIGFRKIEPRNGQLYVNGNRVKLTGACHHEIDPLSGRADTMRHAEQDVRLLKAANLNYIRTSHYPPCQELLDAADRIGMYVEVEAPFCWVGEADMALLKQVLTPTSAMVDYCHIHPSVIVWSLANESSFNPLFEVSNRLCRDLDPTRPTTFNNPDPKRICDIANLHYPPMPFDDQLKGDPRPIFLGEYDFPVCHEQTDVRIDPGLRELWGAGHTEPDSAWGRTCAASYDPATMRPGSPSGTWSYMFRSNRIIGGAIWAALDEPYYFSNGKRAGYAWVHGFWGLIDAWRRPKPEWWLSKLKFSPVWFPVRHLPFTAGQKTVLIPIENRYSFTNLRELRFDWNMGGKSGRIRVEAAPASTSKITLAIPAGTLPGDSLILRVTDAKGELVNAVNLQFGERPAKPLPGPRAGAPRWSEDGKSITVEGDAYRLAFDLATMRFSADGVGSAAVSAFPVPHITQYDFGDLDGPYRRPYAVLPDIATRVINSVESVEVPEGVKIKVQDRYKELAGSMCWIIDRQGMGRVEYDYVYSGPDMSAREVGIRFMLKPGCDELQWTRWSEWGVYPTDSISRTEGAARAHRDSRWPTVPEGTRPAWPWSQDETELGTNDFRSVKLNVYEAALTDTNGAGLRVYANADAHVRACLDPAGVRMHVLSHCRMGPVILKTGDHIKGKCIIELIPRRSESSAHSTNPFAREFPQ